jgi:hypothetical protein
MLYFVGRQHHRFDFSVGAAARGEKVKVARFLRLHIGERINLFEPVSGQSTASDSIGHEPRNRIQYRRSISSGAGAREGES